MSDLPVASIPSTAEHAVIPPVGESPSDAFAPTLRVARAEPHQAELHRMEAAPIEPLPSLPGYDMLSVLGRGGMGVVYRARQRGLDRPVAVKMVRSGEFASPQEVARFRAEAEAIARLRHPNIVQIFEVGELAGRPFFSMELAEGGTLAGRLGGTPLKPELAAEIVETLASAVDAAHRAGIVHRDLKPANVLLTADGAPKITDFGLAKRIEEATGPTATDAIMGTPGYMAPEQARGESKRVGPSADVYALGAILYETLTGRPPFAGTTPVDTILQVVSNDPVPPRQLQPGTPRDLETICLKCLQKEPAKRYGGARELADDMRRYRTNEPILARPVSLSERAVKWARRHRAVASLLAGLAAVITLSLLGLTGLWLRSESIAREEAAQRKEKESQLVRMYVENGVRLMDEGDLAASLPWFTRALADERGGPTREVAHQQRLAAVWHQCPQPLFVGRHEVPTGGFAEFSPDGRRFLTAGPEGIAQVRDTNTCEPVGQPLRLEDRIIFATFSHDGRRVATTGDGGHVRVWDAETGQPTTPPMRQPTDSWQAAFSPDDTLVATGGKDGFARLWNAATGEPATPPLAHEPGTHVETFAFSPDGKMLATGGWDGTLRLWDTATGRPLREPIRHGARLSVGGFNADGTRVATSSYEEARVWNVQTGELAFPPLRHSYGELYRGMVYSPDGRRIVTIGSDRTARLWDADTGAPAAPPLTHRSEVGRVCFHPDGKQLFTAGWDGLVLQWETSTGRPLGMPVKHNGKVNAIAVHPEGTRVATSCLDGTTRVWSIESGRPIERSLDLHGHLSSVVFSADASRVAVAAGGSSQVADTFDGQRNSAVFASGGRFSWNSLSRDGRLLVTFGDAGTILVRDVETGREVIPPISREGKDGAWAMLSPDALRLVVTNVDATARIYDARDGKPVSPVLHHDLVKDRDSTVRHGEFSPDGRLVVTAAIDGTARIWDAESGRLVCPPLRHGAQLRMATFSPDGRRVVTASFDYTARVWDVATGDPVTDPLRHSGEVQMAGFSADGSKVVTASLDHTARVWDAATGQPLCPPLRHADYVVHATFDAEGRRVLTSGWDRTARLWDVETGQPLGPPLRHSDKVQRAAFTKDRRVVSVSHDHKLWTWEIPEESRPAAEWHALSELISGHRIDDQGGVTALDARSLEANWRNLRRTHPAEASSPPTAP